MAPLSPRIRSLLSAISTLAGPPLTVLALNSILGAQLPLWLLVPTSILSIPLNIAARVGWVIRKDKRDAERLGAKLPPRFSGKWIGDVDLMAKFLHVFKTGYFGDMIAETFDELGNVYEIYVLWQHDVLTCNPEHIKTILSTDFNNYIKGPQFHEHVGQVLGEGVFNSDGDMWKFHRTMTRPFFNRDRISHFELFDRHAEEAISKMKDRLAAGYAVDFQDLISRFTLDSATEFLFGSCVHSLSSELPYPFFVKSIPSTSSSSSTDQDNLKSNVMDFAQAFADAQMVVARRLRRGKVWPWWEFLKDEAREPMKVVDTYLEPILKEAIEKSERQDSSEKFREMNEVGEEETLLDYLVKHTKDPVVLHDETLNIMIAGRDTTASTLTFVIYFLCIYPHVLHRLREEILERVGPTNRPSYEDIKEMKYLRAVINETLRLYPAVPINVRTNVKATTWPNPDPNGKPFYIPADSSVAFSVFMMHRRKEYWGPDAEEFDPDRFIDHRLQKYLIPNPFIFLPFNAGPRICLGQQFAYNETSFFLIRLLQHFSLMSLDPQSQPPDSRPPPEWRVEANKGTRKGIEEIFPKVHLTMYSQGGLWVKMGERRET